MDPPVHRRIGLLQRLLPESADRLWQKLLFHGHPMIRRLGARRGWLEVETVHPSGELTTHFTQQLEGLDEGQQVPTFPMSLMARMLVLQHPKPPRSATRFFDLLPADRFLEEIESEGIAYREAKIDR